MEGQCCPFGRTKVRFIQLDPLWGFEVSNAVRDLLRSFDSLSEVDKSEVVIEVVRRAPHSFATDLSEDTLVTVAEGLFATMDAEETANADA